MARRSRPKLPRTGLITVRKRLSCGHDGRMTSHWADDLTAEEHGLKRAVESQLYARLTLVVLTRNALSQALPEAGMTKDHVSVISHAWPKDVIHIEAMSCPAANPVRARLCAIGPRWLDPGAALFEL